MKGAIHLFWNEVDPLFQLGNSASLLLYLRTVDEHDAHICSISPKYVYFPRREKLIPGRSHATSARRRILSRFPRVFATSCQPKRSKFTHHRRHTPFHRHNHHSRRLYHPCLLFGLLYLETCLLVTCLDQRLNERLEQKTQPFTKTIERAIPSVFSSLGSSSVFFSLRCRKATK